MQSRRRLLPILAIVLSLLACSLLPPTPPPIKPSSATATAVIMAATSAAQTATAAVQPQAHSATVTAQPTNQPGLDNPQNLSKNSPWLVYTTQDGLAVVNADGRGHTNLALPPLLDPAADLQYGLARGTGWIALRTAEDPRQLKGLGLTLLHLPDGEVRQATSLLSPALQEKTQQAVASGNPLPDPVQVILQPDSLSWSPDGETLAFMAAINGPSSDLYLYRVNDSSITQKTSGTNQAGSPVWSPDGKWIILEELVRSEDGKQWNTLTVWAAAAGPADIRRLYDLAYPSLGEHILGWTAADDFLTASRSAEGEVFLRAAHIYNIPSSILLRGPFAGTAYDAQDDAIALLESKADLPATSLNPGIYLTDTSPHAPRLVQNGEWQRLEWFTEANLFLASGMQGILTFRANGENNLVPGEGWGVPSPSRQWLTCWGGPADANRPGVRLYLLDGYPLQEITQEPTYQVIWRPDSSGFFYITRQNLYYVAFPQAKPVLLEDTLSADQPAHSMGWVGLP